MTSRPPIPLRGEIWMTDFGHVVVGPDGRKEYTRFREHADRRPCLVLSVDRFNASRAELVIVVPITKQDKRIPTHIRIDPPEGGVRMPSFAICEGVRSVARQFLEMRWGRVEPRTLAAIELRLRDLLGF